MDRAALRRIAAQLASAQRSPAVREPFAAAVDGAVPLRDRTRVAPPVLPRRPRAAAVGLPVEVAMIVDRSGERLLARGPDLDEHTLQDLAAGMVRVEQTCDLHGASRDQVEALLGGFLLRARRDMRRCVLIVHGHGGSQAERQPRAPARAEAGVRIEVRHALVGALSGLVLAAASALPKDGGHGSTYVMVRT